MAKLNPTFKFFDNESKANEFCEMENKRYPWRKHRASYTPWSNAVKTENRFVAFYWV